MRAIQRGFPHTLVMMHVSRTIFKLSLYRFTSQNQTLAWFGLAEGEKTTGDDGYDIDNDDGKVR